jgi:hypothetical protein
MEESVEATNKVSDPRADSPILADYIYRNTLSSELSRHGHRQKLAIACRLRTPLHCCFLETERASGLLGQASSLVLLAGEDCTGCTQKLNGHLAGTKIGHD